ncbi:MAG: hypothetical protein ABEJ76_08380 [Halanaeroarchaeum sp.]
MSDRGSVTAETDSGPFGTTKEFHINADNVAITSFRRGEPTGIGLVLILAIPALGWYAVDWTVGTGSGVAALVLFLAVISWVVDLGVTEVVTNAETFDFEGDEEKLEQLERALQRQSETISVSKSRAYPHKSLTYRIHLNPGQISSIAEASQVTASALLVNGVLGIGLMIDWVFVLLRVIDGRFLDAAGGFVVGVLGIAILVAFNALFDTPRRIEVTTSNGESHFFDVHPADADRIVSQFTGRSRDTSSGLF